MDSFLQALADLAPTIGSFVVPPVGTAVGIGIKTLAQALTGEKEPDKIVAALQADPAKLAEFETKAKELHLQTLQAYINDTADARKSMVSLAQTKSPLAYGSVVISILVLGAFAVNSMELFSIVHDKIAVDNNTFQLLIYLEGSLTTMAGQVCNYWLGSSKGSADKNDILSKMTQQPATNVLPWKKAA